MEVGSGTGAAATLNTAVLPPIALNPLVVEKMKSSELEVKWVVIVAPPRPPEANVKLVIGVVKFVKSISNEPFEPKVLPENEKVTCVPLTLAEPDSPLPVPQEVGGPTQKPGPDTPTVNGPADGPVIVTLPVTVPEALKVPLSAALALVAENRHRTPAMTAVEAIAPRLVLLAAGLRNFMFVPSL
jgi:hypothetical protein